MIKWLSKIIKLNQKYMTKYIPMTKKDLQIKSIMDKVLNKEILLKEAKELIWKSQRQTIRIKNNYIKHWVEWIIHKARWKPSNHKEDEEKYKEIIQIIQEKYYDFWPTLASEKLFELHNIKISIPTLRNQMIKHLIWKSKKRKNKDKTFQFRPRKENIWEMIQYDWSYHKWFEWRNESCYQCLLVAIDDASWEIMIKFDKNEWLKATLNFWKEYILKYWKPKSIYLDKFSTYKINYPEAEDNKDLITQFWRICNILWIKLIFANTPQAKWRVERMNQTLQDRLVKELRLQNISDINSANNFVKEKFENDFNKKFKYKTIWNSDLHIKLREDEIQNLDSIFSIHHKRKIWNDYTVMFRNKLYQLFFSWVMFFKWDHVTIEELLDWSLRFVFKDKYINYQEILQRPKREFIELIPPKKPENSSYFQKTWKCHPWMKNFILHSK